MKTRIPLMLLAFAVAAAPSAVQAQTTRVWDTSTAAGFQNANGTWGTDNFWTTTSGGTTLTGWTSGDEPWFGGNATVAATPGGDFTITVSGTQTAGTVRQIQNGAGNFTLTGGSLNISGIRVDRGIMTVNSTVVTRGDGTPTISYSVINGTDTLIIGGNNTFTNELLIAGNAGGGGKILVNHQNALGLGTQVRFNNGSNLDLNGYSISGKDIRVGNTRTGFLVNTGAGNSVWSGNVILDNASPNTVGFRAGGTGGEVEVSGVISGSSQNTVSTFDSGTLRLSGANTYDALTSLRTGSTLIVGNASALGSTNLGTDIGSGATLDLNGFNVGTEALTLTTTTSKLVNSNTTTAATAGGAVTISSTTGEIGGPGNLTLSGVVSSTATGGFTKVGAGTLTLSGANTYTGGTTVSAGTLALSGSGTLGASTNALTISGGNVNLGGLSRNVGAFTLSTGTLANGTLTATSYALTDAGSISASLAGSGGLTKSGTGVATLSGSNSYSGTTTISGGLTSFLCMDNANALGSGTSVLYSATSGLDLNGFNVSGKTITVAAGQTGILDNTSATKSVWSGTVDVGSSGSGTLRGGGTGAEVEISGVISGSNGMATHDNGVLRLTGNNTYSGGFSIRTNSVLIVGHVNALGAKSGTAFIGTTGTLDLNGFDVGSQPITLQQDTSRLVNNNTSTAANVDGAITLLRTGSLRHIGGDGDLTLGGAIGSDANVNGFTKVGTGVLTLAGNNTYTGGTTVNAGGLLVNGNHSGAGLMTVANGARIGGAGSLAGGLTIASGGLFVFNPLDPTLDVTGAVSLASTFGVASLVNADGSSINWGAVANTSYSLIGLTSSTFSGITNFGVGAAAPIGVGRTAYFTNTTESGGLTLVVVPEPGALALGLAGLGIAAWVRRRL